MKHTVFRNGDMISDPNTAICVISFASWAIFLLLVLRQLPHPKFRKIFLKTLKYLMLMFLKHRSTDPTFIMKCVQRPKMRSEERRVGKECRYRRAPDS